MKLWSFIVWIEIGVGESLEDTFLPAHPYDY